jgi:hypothetical protein
LIAAFSAAIAPGGFAAIYGMARSAPALAGKCSDKKAGRLGKGAARLRG